MSIVKTPKGTDLPLLKLQGKDYLQVPYRVIWFRETHPDFSIETEIIQHSDDHSVVKATVKDTSGRVLSTAHQREDKKNFMDHLAKAETAALGRALANLGFGTQFALELDEGERIADAPLPKYPPPPTAEDFNKYNIVKEKLKKTAPDQQEIASYANYTIKAGKSKGKTLKAIGIGNVIATLEFWKDKKAEGVLLDDLNAMEEFKKEVASKNLPIRTPEANP